MPSSLVARGTPAAMLKLEPVEPTFNSWSDNRPVYQPRPNRFKSSYPAHLDCASKPDRLPSQSRPLPVAGDSSSGQFSDNSPFAHPRSWNHTRDSLITIKPDEFLDCTLPPIRSPAQFLEENIWRTASPSASPATSRSSSDAAMSSNDSTDSYSMPHADNSRSSINYQPSGNPMSEPKTSLQTSKSSPPSNPKTACHYMGPCETGAPPRKVVSQIFGRNKICTREIPEDLWPVYCRKHYQRHKYRNADGFAKTQCDLVLTTVERLDTRCKVKDYTIILRKKEADKFKISQATSTAEDESQIGHNEYRGGNEAIRGSSGSNPPLSREFAERGLSNRMGEIEIRNGDNGEGSSNGATVTDARLAPRPFDLGDFAGEGQVGKSSAFVRGVIHSIRAAIESKALAEFPGIEILPNFGTRDTPTSQRKAPPRKRARRSISDSRQAAIPGISIMTTEAAAHVQQSSPDSSPVRPSRLQGRGFVTRASQRDTPRSLSIRARTLHRGLNPDDH